MSARVACAWCGGPKDADTRFCGHCGADSSSEQESSFTRLFGGRRTRSQTPRDVNLELLRERTLGEYEILGELGRGGMATVYLAHEIALGRKVALKLLLAGLLDPNIVERFKLEARTAAGLSHPHIIPVYTVRESHPLIYLTMKFIAGCSLESMIKEQRQLPIPMVLTILGQVGYALGYAHRQGVIHRDIKPGNVMIDQEGWAMVTDFGIAKATASPGITATGFAIGTPSYMSPEQWRGEGVSGASDQYSLGVVAYEMLSGARPFVAESAASAMWAHVNEAPRPIQELRPECPGPLAQAVMRMLEKSPSARWPTIEEAVRSAGPQTFPPDNITRECLVSLAQTGAALQASRLIQTPVSPVPLSRRTDGRRRSLLRWLTIVATVAGLGIGIAWWSQRTTNESVPAPRPATPAAEPVSAIAIAGVPSTMTQGDTVHLEALPKNSAGNLLHVKVAWATTHPAIVSVSEDGRLTAVGPGEATITATAGGKQSSFGVVVERAAVASLEILPGRSRIAVKDSIALHATVRDAAGNVLPDRPQEWASSAPDVATVSSVGIVTGLAPGVADITVSSEDVTSRPGTIRVVAPPRRAAALNRPPSDTAKQPAAVASLEILPGRSRIAVKDSMALQAAVRDAAGNVLPDRPLEWASSAPDVATVSSVGIVTGLASGVANITVSSEGVTSSPVTILVIAPPSRAAVLNRPPLVIAKQPTRLDTAAAQREIRAVIERQRRATELQDLDLALRDVAPAVGEELRRGFRVLREVKDITSSVRQVQIQIQSPVRARAVFHDSIAATRTSTGKRLVLFNGIVEYALTRMDTGWIITTSSAARSP